VAAEVLLEAEEAHLVVEDEAAALATEVSLRLELFQTLLSAQSHQRGDQYYLSQAVHIYLHSSATEELGQTLHFLANLPG
jgi:hypothetical protein